MAITPLLLRGLRRIVASGRSSVDGNDGRQSLDLGAGVVLVDSDGDDEGVRLRDQDSRAEVMEALMDSDPHRARGFKGRLETQREWGIFCWKWGAGILFFML